MRKCQTFVDENQFNKESRELRYSQTNARHEIVIETGDNIQLLKIRMLIDKIIESFERKKK